MVDLFILLISKMSSLFCSGPPASTFCPLTNQNSAQLPMQFILQLHRPVVLSKSVISRIQKMTGDVLMCFARHCSITAMTAITSISSFWAFVIFCLLDSVIFNFAFTCILYTSVLLSLFKQKSFSYFDDERKAESSQCQTLC